MGKNLFAYAALGVITSPVWVPIALAGYLGYKATRFAFANPKTTAASLALGGLVWYAGCQKTVSTVTAGAQKVVETYRSHETSDLEKRLQREYEGRILAEAQTKRLRVEIEKTESQPRPTYVQTVTAQPAAPTRSSVEQSPAQQAPVGQPTRQVQAVTDPHYAFYFVKTDETIEGIAAKVGSPGTSGIIAQDNGISDPRKLLAGQLLKIRRGIITRSNPDVYERIPVLRSTVLPGNVSITQACQQDRDCITNVFTVSRELGLDYGDDFPYKHGARIVYYR